MASSDEEAHQLKMACLEQLGAVIPKKNLKDEFFDHFDKILGVKLTRPKKKSEGPSTA